MPRRKPWSWLRLPVCSETMTFQVSCLNHAPRCSHSKKLPSLLPVCSETMIPQEMLLSLQWQQHFAALDPPGPSRTVQGPPGSCKGPSRDPPGTFLGSSGDPQGTSRDAPGISRDHPGTHRDLQGAFRDPVAPDTDAEYLDTISKNLSVRVLCWDNSLTEVSSEGF